MDKKIDKQQVHMILGTMLGALSHVTDHAVLRQTVADMAADEVFWEMVANFPQIIQEADPPLKLVP